MTYDLDRDGARAVLTLKGTVDEGPESAQLCDDLRACARSGVTRLVVDCAGVKQMKPLGLGVLAGAHALMRDAGGAACLVRLPDPVLSLILIAGFQTVFMHADTVEDALDGRTTHGLDVT